MYFVVHIFCLFFNLQVQKFVRKIRHKLICYKNLDTYICTYILNWHASNNELQSRIKKNNYFELSFNLTLSEYRFVIKLLERFYKMINVLYYYCNTTFCNKIPINHEVFCVSAPWFLVNNTWELIENKV